MLYSATSVGVVCCLWTASGGVLTGAAFGSNLEGWPVRDAAALPLSLPCHIRWLSQASHEAHPCSAHCQQLAAMALLDQEVPWRPSAGWGRLEAPFISKGARWPSPLLYQCRMVQSACLPLLNCGQKTVHPSSFLKYLHTPWGLLIFPTCFSTWYLVQGGAPIWH